MPPEDGYLETDYGERQLVQDVKTMTLVEQMDRYMHEYVFVEPESRHVKDRCKNNNEKCAYWASRLECSMNPQVCYEVRLRALQAFVIST